MNRWPRMCCFSTITLLVVSGLSTAAEPPAGSVEFIVGDYLKAEGGTWDSEQSPLREPFGIDFDASGSMYIIELSSGRLHRRLPSGSLQTLRGLHSQGYAGDGGPVSEAVFNGPHNCIVSNGDMLLISDSWNHCIRQVDLKTYVTQTLAGTGVEGFSGDNGSGRSAIFNFIMCIALDPTKKILHIADLKNRRVRNMDMGSGHVQTVAGNGHKGTPTDGRIAKASPLVDPRAVASDVYGNLYILERGGHALRVVRPHGIIYTVAGNGKKGFRDGEALQAQFGSPKHICCDPEGKVYIADDLNGAVRQYDPWTGRVSTVLGRGRGDARITLEHPHGVCWHRGSLYVIDTGHNRILRLPTGQSEP
jgi:sugar lactone lactonase YvrE